MPSTVISAILYDPVYRNSAYDLRVRNDLRLKNVPETIYAELKDSGAKGIFLNQEIKGKYPYVKIK
ncbi:MAG: KTSC domain-containing protein [Ginsengibacter sp.]